MLLIPGIGGHPEFHRGFIKGFPEHWNIHSNHHVDFFGEPCFDWLGHVAYWREQLTTLATARRSPGAPVVVGVSFGAHIAAALRRQVPESAARCWVLISYWRLAALERRLLAALRRVPRVAAPAVGRFVFGWSESQSEDVTRLHALRRELYDDPALVHRRLLARLTALASAPPMPDDDPNLGFIFGSREWALRRIRRHPGVPGRTMVVSGDHSVSLHGTAELVAAVRRLAGETARQPGDPLAGDGRRGDGGIR